MRHISRRVKKGLFRVTDTFILVLVAVQSTILTVSGGREDSYLLDRFGSVRFGRPSYVGGRLGCVED